MFTNLEKGYPPESSTHLKFKENKSQQFTSPCNVNHKKYMTSQSNDVAACEIGKSHMAFSLGQNLGAKPILHRWKCDESMSRAVVKGLSRPQILNGYFPLNLLVLNKFAWKNDTTR
jgi:beta-glucanase (GH16 family)